MSGRFEIIDPPALVKELAEHVFTTEIREHDVAWSPEPLKRMYASCRCGEQLLGEPTKGGKPPARLRQAMKDHVDGFRFESGLITEFPEPALLGRVYAQRGTRFKEFWLYHRYDPRMPADKRPFWMKHVYPWTVVSTDLDLRPARWANYKTPASAVHGVDKFLQTAVRDGKQVDNLTEGILESPSAPIPNLAYLIGDLVKRAKATTKTPKTQAFALVKEIDEAIGYLDVLKDVRAELLATTFSLD